MVQNMLFDLNKSDDSQMSLFNLREMKNVANFYPVFFIMYNASLVSYTKIVFHDIYLSPFSVLTVCSDILDII